MSKTAYQGGCHCGRVRFEIRVDLTRAVQCNCSMCTRRGAVTHRTMPEDFTLLSGEGDLNLYQFGTRTAKLQGRLEEVGKDIGAMVSKLDEAPRGTRASVADIAAMNAGP